MTRLIDADALNEKLCKTTIFIKGGEIFQRMINDAPTIELSGDTISRQELMSRLEDFCKWCKDGRLQGAEFVLDCLVPNTPSAPDSRQRGEWEPNLIDLGFGKPVVDSYSCSECKEECNLDYDYCPNCGADMRGEQDENR